MIREQIPDALGGERLDRIVALLTDASRSDAAALVAAGGASVNGSVVVSGKVRVAVGDVVEIDPSELPSKALPVGDASIEVAVLYADDDVIVVDKPSGLVVHPGHGHPDGTLVNALLARFPDMAEVGDPFRPGIVHRLDVGTSGVMVVARSAVAYDSLVAALSSRSVARTYNTLVWGHLDSPKGLIDAPIGRDHRDPLRMAVVIDGKPARTRYRTVETYVDPTEVALLECQLETGRTHQIRVHLAAAGHPVVGDGQYGGQRSAITAHRPFLHAASLGFTHPVTGQ
ncbi:MAG TPA: RluA family pseudouridine synthase, partial [Ilumatobacteraceae bacterium]|nr:RluA family pseudouridine synthase [Ilumatobacteraceae bacterium]